MYSSFGYSLIKTKPGCEPTIAHNIDKTETPQSPPQHQWFKQEHTLDSYAIIRVSLSI